MLKFSSLLHRNIFIIVLSLSKCLCDPPANCQKKNSHQIDVYFDWPFNLNCNNLKLQVSNELNDKDNIICTILNENGEQVNEEVWTVKENSLQSLNFTAILASNNKCFTNEIILNAHKIKNDNCKSSLQNTYKEIKTESITFGHHIVLGCGSESLIPKGVDQKDFKTTWYKNCGFDNIDGDGIRYATILKKTGFPDSLRMDGVDFYSAGNYTCSVEYKGMTLNVVHYSLCIKQNTYESSYTPTLTCQTKEIVAKGERASLSCIGQISLGQVKQDELKVYWQVKDSETILCSNSRYNITVKESKKYSCVIRGNNSTIRCENAHDGYKMDVQKARREVAIELFINNVDDIDYKNKLLVTLNHLHHTISKQIVLEQDWSPYFKHLRDKVLAPVLAVLLSLCAASVIVWWFLLEIKILFKRYFGKYVGLVDDKKFVFYLLHDYNMNGETKDNEYVKKICKVVRQISDDMGYDYFEEQQNCDAAGKVRIEVITNSIQNSHCMVVIMTKSFFENNWAIFQSDVGISSSTPIIFIFTPGSRKLLNKAHGWKTMSQVARASYKINWTPNMPDKKLLKHVTYALPKLKPKDDYSQIASCSTSTESIRENCKRVDSTYYDQEVA